MRRNIPGKVDEDEGAEEEGDEKDEKGEDMKENDDPSDEKIRKWLINACGYNAPPGKIFS